MSSATEIRRLTADDWHSYRRIGLAALATDPDAFGSTLEHAQALPDEEWKARIERSAVFVGEFDVQAVGLAIGIDAGQGAELVSMWVAPDFRGTGLAARLVQSVVDWAAGAGYDEIRLWVVEGNLAAQRAYAKCGFEPTGRRQPHPRAQSVMELEMARATSRPRRTA